MKLVICTSKTSEYTQTHVQYTNLTPTTTKNMNLNKFPFFLNHICRCVCLCYGLVFNSSKFSHLMSFSAFLFILISSFFYYVVMIFPLLCWSWLFVSSFLPDLLCSPLSVFSPATHSSTLTAHKATPAHMIVVVVVVNNQANQYVN